MPHVTFIHPCIGRFQDTPIVKTWQMQPLVYALLSALTPPEWGRKLIDDRVEKIDYDIETDLVAISLETFTAKRGYQIAAKFRERGVPVVVGGYHPTFCPDEALEYADAICVGEGEGVWKQILEDTLAGKLKGIYQSRAPKFIDVKPDRSIFEGKRYLDLALVENGRGCCYECGFCSVSAFHNATYRRRPVEAVIEELKSLKNKQVFFVDDNIVSEFNAARELFSVLKQYKIQWVSQASLSIARDQKLLNEMVASGCVGLLVGFESLDQNNIEMIKKPANRVEQYSEDLKKLQKAGIKIYGSFVFGYPNDTPESFEKTLNFVKKHKMFMAAINHLVPFPGTPLYAELETNGQLPGEKWWLSDNYRFGQAPFITNGRLNNEQIVEHCNAIKKKFYSLGSIFMRGLDFRANCKSFKSAMAFIGLNLIMRREVSHKRGFPLGVRHPE